MPICTYVSVRNVDAGQKTAGGEDEANRVRTEVDAWSFVLPKIIYPKNPAIALDLLNKVKSVVVLKYSRAREVSFVVLETATNLEARGSFSRNDWGTEVNVHELSLNVQVRGQTSLRFGGKCAAGQNPFDDTSSDTPCVLRTLGLMHQHMTLLAESS